jgi:hypothetical protein
MPEWCRRPRHRAATASVAAAVLLLAACSTGGPPTPAASGDATTPGGTAVSESPASEPSTTARPSATASAPRATSTPTRKPSATPSPTPTKPVNADYRKFDPDNFGEPIGAKNRWFPLVAGNQSLRDGSLNRGSRRLHHQRRLTVTDVVKEIDGVRTVLLLDQDIDAGQNGETAVDYLAQDKSGNVWYLGSYTEAYEGGEFVNARDAWLAGTRDASAGVLLLADPKEDMKYVEADIPGQETIRARVAKVGERKCVPFRCFAKTLTVLEDGSELKYYASGVGHIATEPNYEGGEQEKEALINVIQLTRKGLDEASKEALRLDRHAAKEAKRIFGNSKPARRV